MLPTTGSTSVSDHTLPPGTTSPGHTTVPPDITDEFTSITTESE